MATAKYVQRGDSIDFRPLRDMPAGEVVRLGNLIGVTRLSIREGELGALAVSGVFDLNKPPGLAFPAGASVRWLNGQLTASGGLLLGIAIMPAPEDSPTVRILLNFHGQDQPWPSGCGEWQTLS